MAYGNRMGDYGQGEVAIAAGSEVAKLVGGLFGGGGPPQVDAKRKQLIDAMYTAALNGDATGLAQLQTWVADYPPHPPASNAYAASKIAALQQRAGGKGGVGGQTGIFGPGMTPGPGANLASMLGTSGMGSLPVLAGVGLLVYVLMSGRHR
jgi:hypothetical protein